MINVYVLSYLPDCIVPVWCNMCRTNYSCRTCLQCVVNSLPLIVECVFGGLQYLISCIHWGALGLCIGLCQHSTSFDHHLMVISCLLYLHCTWLLLWKPIQTKYANAECSKAILPIASCCIARVQVISNFWTAWMLLCCYCLMIITCALSLCGVNIYRTTEATASHNFALIVQVAS